MYVWVRVIVMYICMCGLGILSCTYICVGYGYRHVSCHVHMYVWVRVIVMYICMCGLGISSCTYVCVG